MRSIVPLSCSLLRCSIQSSRQLSLGSLIKARSNPRYSPPVARTNPLPARPLRVIARCGLFTVVSVNSLYFGSAIFGFERWHRHTVKPKLDAIPYGIEVLRKCEALIGRPFYATDLYWAIVAVNVIVFLANRTPYGNLLLRYFANSPHGRTPALSMLLSVFSHTNPIHLAVNMYVLYSFTPTLIRLLGPGDYLFLFLGGGIFASFISLTNKAVRGSLIPSVGASGGICAILGAFCLLQPHAHLCVPFLVNAFPHSFEAGTAAWALLCMESMAALLVSRSPIDHAAHMGGLLFGMYYSFGGLDAVWKRRAAIIALWKKWRGF